MSIIANISQRTKVVGGVAVDNPDITIYRIGQANVVVPITARSVRRYRLMQEDYIQLDFSLVYAEHFGIGDYINDPIFGHFVISTEQMPRYNQQNGGYDYSLRFDADYMGWRNWIHCLVSNGERMESRWNLTDRLEVHAQQIADNVNAIIQPTINQQVDSVTGDIIYVSSGYGIEVTATNAAEIKHLAYEGVDIITAMTAIADAWQCEWWVTDDAVRIDNWQFAKTIHFGKCENGSRPYVLALNNNVESMDVARDQQDFANRIYAFGGTQNIPDDYDRKLVFTATLQDRTAFNDPQRELTLDMIDAPSSIPSTEFTAGSWADGGTPSHRTYTQTYSAELYGIQTIDTLLMTQVYIDSVWLGTQLPVVGMTATLHIGDEDFVIANAEDIAPMTDQPSATTERKIWNARINFNGTYDVGGTASRKTQVTIDIVWTLRFLDDTHTSDLAVKATSGTCTATKDAASATKQVQVVINGNTYTGTFSGETGYITLSSLPTGFNTGSKYTIDNLNILRVPMSFYTLDYDAGTVAKIGERRLHLPLDQYPNRYVETVGLTPTQTVEKVYIFDDVFPRLELVITDVYGERKQQQVEHSDGSVTYEDWTQYRFKVARLEEGVQVPFVFSTDYLLDGNKLQAVFTAPTTMQTSGFMLGGMTFDVGFKDIFGAQWYTIIRNEDYGALLPDNRLKPSVGDTLVLVGWNPQAMKSLGMVGSAEEELATKANEALNAINEGQFTVTCKMMSRTMMAYPFCTGSGKDSYGRRLFGLLGIGTKVSVTHDALPNGAMTSRIIGCEYKLDMPFDTPSYTIGETDAYSRLKQIEKQLTKL